ncbi:MAG: PAS domain S-box protein [Pseudomonadota bacterium]
MLQSFLSRLLALIALVTLPWLYVLGYELLERREHAEAEALAQVRQRTVLLAREVDDTLQRSRRLLDFLSQRPEVTGADAHTCQALMQGLVTTEPMLANLGLVDPQGRVLCSADARAGQPTGSAGPGEAAAALAGGALVVGPPRWGAGMERPVLALARPVEGPTGQPVGALLVAIDLQSWSESWQRHAGVPGSTLVVQNEAGLIVGRYPEPLRWIGHDASERYEAFRRATPEGLGPGIGIDGVRRFYAAELLPSWGWIVLAGTPEDEVMAPARGELARAAAGLTGLTLLVLWLAWRLSRRLVAPLQHLAATAAAVAQGRPEARADEQLPGELGEVAVEFNRMLDSRDQAQARLATSEKRFREMLDTVELFAIAADREGRITYCNDCFLRRTGWSFDELNGEDFGERCIPPERRGGRERWREAVREGRLPPHSEAAILTRSGERRLVRWSSTVLRDEQGAVVGRASIGEDVTDQRRAELQVQRLTGFLAALSRIQRAISHRVEREVLLQEACSACVDAAQARIASAWWVEPGGLVAQAWAGPAEALFGPMPARRDPNTAGFADTLTGRALSCGLAGVSNRIADDPQAADWRERAESAGVQAQAVFPLRCAGEIVGVLLLHVDAAHWFDEPLVDLLRQLADDLAFALDNLQRERSRIEAQRQSALDHRRFKSIFDASPMGIAVRTLDDSRLLDVNPVFAQRVGLAREQLIGRSMGELGVGMSPADHERLMALMREHGRARDFEARVRDANGRERDVVFNAELIEYGDRPAVLTISHDMTDRREAERRLAARERQLAGIVETAMDAIVTVDAAQRIVMFNRAAAELFRVPAEQVLGQSLDDFVPPDLLERHKRGIRAFAEGSREQVVIGNRRLLYGVRTDGERFPFEAAVSRQGEGERMTMTAVIRDLSERVAAEAAREARTLAELASRAKTDFLSRMSHELRTPLNAMLGFAQLLSDDPREPLSPRQQRHLALTREAGWHLLALIDDVLDVSRIEAGEMDMRSEPVVLQPLIESALSVSATLAARHRVRLAPAPVLPPGLAAQADATRLRQVVLNLLSNGCKYNHPGGQVVVEVRDEGERVCLDVVDDGAGMNEEQLAHLFEPFNRLGREKGTVEGTGIGLHLTRQLVLKMGGSIEAASTPGLGTRMRVCLPRARANGAAAKSAGRGATERVAASDCALEGAVLYVEDNPVNLMLVEQFLLRWPCVQLFSADTAEGGLARLRAERFDLVLLDMQLPDMHGTELLVALRREGLLGTTPVVALSASAMPEAVDAALAAGATEYWTKPLDLARLGSDLRRFLRVVA